MKIRLEIPKVQELPSQGRNADSNSAGSATAFEDAENRVSAPWLGATRLKVRAHYRAWLDLDKPDAEFVFFVGWSAANDKLIFEDAAGDVLVSSPDEIEVV